MKRDFKTTSINDIFRKYKEDTSNSKGIFLPREEYARVISELNSHLSEEDRQSTLIVKPIGDYVYLVINRGFDNYIIIGKYPIDSEIGDL